MADSQPFASMPRVLIVDDDPGVLESLYDELSDGYDVTPLDCGTKALDTLASNRFDAIISDVRMPGMNGVELVRRVQSVDPEMVRILLTGYSDDAALEVAWMPGGVYKLGKPWGDELDIILRRALEHQRRIRDAHAQLDSERMARERAELVVAQLDKMASLGTLAAGVAHEMRTPLTYLRANFEWLQSELANVHTVFGATQKALMLALPHGTAPSETIPEQVFDEIHQVAKECSGGIDRLVDILESLRDYSSPRPQRPKRVDLRQCVEQAVVLVSCRFTHDVVFDVQIADEEVFVNGNEGELGQIIINLYVNAAQAMRGRGTITSRVFREGDRVFLEVSDEGDGVPAEVIPRLFDTFFTTKQDEKGTGLGLAISSEIARRHHGELRYEARDTPGATFVLELPALSASTFMSVVPAEEAS